MFFFFYFFCFKIRQYYVEKNNLNILSQNIKFGNNSFGNDNNNESWWEKIKKWVGEHQAEILFGITIVCWIAAYKYNQSPPPPGGDVGGFIDHGDNGGDGGGGGHIMGVNDNSNISTVVERAHIEPVCVVEPIEPIRIIEPIEPARIVESIEPIESVRIIEPIESVRIIEPIEPVRIIEPIEPIRRSSASSNASSFASAPAPVSSPSPMLKPVSNLVVNENQQHILIPLSDMIPVESIDIDGVVILRNGDRVNLFQGMPHLEGFLRRNPVCFKYIKIFLTENGDIEFVRIYCATFEEYLKRQNCKFAKISKGNSIFLSYLYHMDLKNESLGISTHYYADVLQFFPNISECYSFSDIMKKVLMVTNNPKISLRVRTKGFGIFVDTYFRLFIHDFFANNLMCAFNEEYVYLSSTALELQKKVYLSAYSGFVREFLINNCISLLPADFFPSTADTHSAKIRRFLTCSSDEIEKLKLSPDLKSFIHITKEILYLIHNNSKALLSINDNDLNLQMLLHHQVLLDMLLQRVSEKGPFLDFIIKK